MAHGFPDWTYSSSAVLPETEEFELWGIGNVSVQNKKIETGKAVKYRNLEFWYSAGAGETIQIGIPVEPGLYDALWLALYSPSGNLSNVTIPTVAFYHDYNNTEHVGMSFSINDVPLVTEGWRQNPNKWNLWGPVIMKFSETKETGIFTDGLGIFIRTGVAVSETMSADIILRYAASEVTNVVGRPAIESPAVGKFDQPIYFRQSIERTGYTTLIDAPGDYLKVVRLTVENYSSDSLTNRVVLYNSLDGSNPLWLTDTISGHSVEQIDVTFPNGIYCNGVQTYCNSTAGLLAIYGCIVKVSTTPNPQVLSVV